MSVDDPEFLGSSHGRPQALVIDHDREIEKCSGDRDATQTVFLGDVLGCERSPVVGTNAAAAAGDSTRHRDVHWAAPGA